MVERTRYSTRFALLTSLAQNAPEVGLLTPAFNVIIELAKEKSFIVILLES